MIASIRGILLQKNISSIIVDVQGVGYEVFIPMSTYDHLPSEGAECSLLTYLSVREDAMTLYGFQSAEEKKLFLMVCNVSGIGPKIGLSILSSLPVVAFCQGIVNQDIKALSRINGIGKRTAERLAVELKDKVSAISDTYLTATSSSSSGEVAIPFYTEAEDAVQGLISLGIKSDAARKTIQAIVAELKGEEASAQKLIRLALSQIQGG